MTHRRLPHAALTVVIALVATVACTLVRVAPAAADTTSGPAGTQSETSIAVDVTGQHVVVGFNDFRGTNSISGFQYSDDGGVTFTDGGQLPVPANTLVRGDPDVHYVPGGAGCQFIYFSILV